VEPNFASVGSYAVFGLLFDAIDSIESFLYVFIVVYTILILAYIITSWVRLPYSPWLNRVQRFLYDVCEPYLRLWRRILPSFGPLDLSPVVGVAFLYILLAVLNSILERLH
jgi:YggT family protein